MTPAGAPAAAPGGRAAARPLSLAAYRVATHLAEPFMPSLLRSRARRGKEDPKRLGERLGHPSAPRPEGPLVWLHAVSVGESLSVLPLIEALRSERPDLALLITSGTRASAEMLALRLPPGVVHQYAPVDAPGVVARFLGHWRPATGIIVESELWPNLVLDARRAGTKLALVSARVVEKSARAWRRQPTALRAMLDSFDLILPQDGATEARLVSFGAVIAGQLNLKRLGQPLGCDEAELGELRSVVGLRRVVVGASTHAPEETLLADAVAGPSPPPVLILVPRHPERGAEIAALFDGRRIARRASSQPLAPDTDIYIADTMGELGLFLRLADVAFVGKSLAHETGGHNPLEPARLGVGVISGPNAENFAEINAEMAGAGAAILVDDPAALAAALQGLLADPVRLAALKAAARAYIQHQGDQLGAAMDLLRPLLPPPTPDPTA